MNSYNYYPNNEYNRNQMDYNNFLNYLGLNDNLVNNLYLKSDGTRGLHFISIEFLIAFIFTIILTSIMDLKYILLGI